MFNDKDLLSAFIAGVVAMLRVITNGDSLMKKITEILTCSVVGYVGFSLINAMGIHGDFSVVIACVTGLLGTDAVRAIMKNKVDKL